MFWTECAAIRSDRPQQILLLLREAVHVAGWTTLAGTQIQ
jgi:hypothetical protein